MPNELGARLGLATLSALGELDGMWDAIDSVRANLSPVQRPENSFTVDEYMQQYGIPYDTARSQLRSMEKAGKLQKHRVRGTDSLGRSVVMAVYTVAK
jgi:Fic family protein